MYMYMYMCMYICIYTRRISDFRSLSWCLGRWSRLQLAPTFHASFADPTIVTASGIPSLSCRSL